MLNYNDIKVIIFDLDGLLIDTESVYNICWRKAAKDFGYDLNFEQALNFRSLDSKLALQYLQSLFGESVEYQEIKVKRNQYMKEIFDKEGIKAKKGAVELLEFLNKNSYKTAIASASDEKSIYEKLSKVGINIKFDYIVSTKSLKRGKPYPDIYLHVCNTLNIKSSEALVFEDSPNGIISASDAGCHVIMIPDLSEPSKELSQLIDKKHCSLLDVINDIEKEME